MNDKIKAKILDVIPWGCIHAISLHELRRRANLYYDSGNTVRIVDALQQLREDGHVIVSDLLGIWRTNDLDEVKAFIRNLDGQIEFLEDTKDAMVAILATMRKETA